MKLNELVFENAINYNPAEFYMENRQKFVFVIVKEQDESETKGYRSGVFFNSTIFHVAYKFQRLKK